MDFKLLFPGNILDLIQTLYENGASGINNVIIKDVFVWLVITLLLFFSLAKFRDFLKNRFNISRHRRVIDDVDKNVETYVNTSGDILKNVDKYGNALHLWKIFHRHLVEIKVNENEKILKRSIDSEDVFSKEQMLSMFPGQKTINAIPGILTGIGVLGTFVGLQLGIGGLDLCQSDVQNIDNIVQKINPIINGCSIAFSTSVWGIFTSLVYTFIEKVFSDKTLSNLKRFQLDVNNMFELDLPEKNLQKLLESSLHSQNTMDGLADQIASKFQTHIQSETEKLLQKLDRNNQNSSALLLQMKDELKTATEEQGRNMVESISNFGRSIGEGTGTAGEKAAEILGESLKTKLNEINQTISGFNPILEQTQTSINDSGKTVSEAVERLDEQGNIIIHLKNSITELDQVVERFITMRETLEDVSNSGRDAARNQLDASNKNLIVAERFDKIIPQIPELQEAMLSVAKTVSSVEVPLNQLQNVMVEQHSKLSEIEKKRAVHDHERNSNLEKITKDFSQQMSELTENFKNVSVLSKGLVESSQILNQSSKNLKSFSESLEHSTKEQVNSSQCLKNVSSELVKVTDENKQLTNAFQELQNRLELINKDYQDLNNGLSNVASTWTENIASNRENALQIAEYQKDYHAYWYESSTKELEALQTRLQQIINMYSDSVEGKTRELMNLWTAEVNNCLEKYGNKTDQVQDLVGELNERLEELSEEIERIRK